MEATAAASCRVILELGASTGSGVYWLRAPSGATYQAYCDMTTDGGLSLSLSVPPSPSLPHTRARARSVSLYWSAAGGWSLIFSSNGVDGHDEEIGTLEASPTQVSLSLSLSLSSTPPPPSTHTHSLTHSLVLTLCCLTHTGNHHPDEPTDRCLFRHLVSCRDARTARVPWLLLLQSVPP